MTNCFKHIHYKIVHNLYKCNQRYLSTNYKQIQKKYGIFITGQPPDHIQQFGDYGDMMINMLSDTKQTNEYWFKYYCLHNEFPTDEIKDLNGIVITGSKYDAHATDEWICKLRETIRSIYNNNNNNLRILGICFGHQIISNALDGESGPAQIGWQLGAQHITFNEEFYKLFPYINTSSLPILKLHQDQVKKLPSNSILLASSCNVAIEMYRIGENILCIQGHPEYDVEYLKQVVEYRNKDGKISDNQKEICLQSLSEPNTYSHMHIKQWHKMLRSWLTN